jgi:hypothetical protein
MKEPISNIEVTNKISLGYADAAILEMETRLTGK